MYVYIYIYIYIADCQKTKLNYSMYGIHASNIIKKQIVFKVHFLNCGGSFGRRNGLSVRVSVSELCRILSSTFMFTFTFTFTFMFAFTFTFTFASVLF